MAQQKNQRPMTDIDAHIAGRIEERRILLGLTRQQLAEAVGVSRPQINKYTRAADRVPASRLYKMACFMGVSIGYFYPECEREKLEPAQSRHRMLLMLMRNFGNIRDEKRQQALFELVSALSGR